ncbi:hypothetical protein [Pseudonocardia sp. Ae150A_Ps1]|uniref:hypothetical protein n=1 Tax=unclassified Pseudonocardia TaxID=2619320 RepID=UPI0032C434AC
MTGRDQPASFLGVEVGGAGGVEEPDELLGRRARPAAGDDGGLLGAAQQLGDSGDVVGVRQRAAAPGCAQVLVEHDGGRHRLPQHVGRDLQVDRPRLGGVAGRTGPALVELAEHLVADPQGAALPGDGPQDLGVRDVLQRVLVGLRPRRAAAEQ